MGFCVLMLFQLLLCVYECWPFSRREKRLHKRKSCFVRFMQEWNATKNKWSNIKIQSISLSISFLCVFILFLHVFASFFVLSQMEQVKNQKKNERKKKTVLSLWSWTRSVTHTFVVACRTKVNSREKIVSNNRKWLKNKWTKRNEYPINLHSVKWIDVNVQWFGTA